jgi:acyl transferase domain-containing protein/NADPH:quinone reductase-like Zn-dependent oxidoreductase/acyl carrier protein/NAD(P)-dependent dehydrogenase (short-subunit alcohol dehydrogenase family)
MYVRFAAFIPGVENFDAPLFRIPPAEATYMDPQGRMLLEQTHLALQNAEFSTKTTIPNDTGVYVGVMHMEYIQYLAGNGARVTPAVTTGNGMDFLIGRVSYTFGLTGPCLSTHTACSSSLVATHLSHTGLLNGEASAAAASGVFMVMLPGTMSGISQLQAFSPVGRCKTFEASGDGYGRGEGCAVAVLAPQGTSTDVAPLAVLVSTVVNQAGRASSLTAPNGPAQTALIADALQNCYALPDDIRLVAVHGTGTPLGDPIETGALGQALSRKGASTAAHAVTIASVKSCYGHTEGAAGLTGALLAIQAARHQATPGIMHLRNTNPYVESSFADWKKSNNLVAQPSRSTAPLPLLHTVGAERQQLVGTSSFGMSGVNSHALIDATTPQENIDNQMVAIDKIGSLSRVKLWPLVPALHMAQRAILPNITARLYAPLAQCSVAVNLKAPALAFLNDHIVGGKAILPGTGMFDALLAAGAGLLDGSSTSSRALLSNITIAEPVALTSSDAFDMVEVTVDLNSGEVVLTSGTPTRRSTHCLATFAAAVASEPASFSSSSSSSSSSTHPAAAVLLPSVHLMKPEEHEEPGCVASIRAPHWSSTSGFVAHPAIADATLHLLSAFSDPYKPATLQVPISAASLSVHRELKSSSTDWVHPSAGPSTARNGGFDCSLGGSFALNDLQVKAWTPAQTPTTKETAADMLEFMYETEWQASIAGVEEKEEASGAQVLRWQAGAATSAVATSDGLRDLQSALHTADVTTNGLHVAISQASSSLISPAGQGSPSTSATSASLVALVKAAAMEYSNVNIQSMLIPSSTTKNSLLPAGTTDGDAFGASSEAGAVLRAKLLRRPLPTAPSNSHIMPLPRGSLANLKLVLHNKESPGTGEVLVAVHAVGLNFRDVLNVLGMYPGDPGPPGGDCAGVVLATGRNVTSFKPGDAVFGLAPGCVGPTVFAPAALLAHKPEKLDFAEAAAAPTIYITVLTALADIVVPGESRVLVHAGTGGVGLAALELTTSLKCNVAATAGAPAKRAHLRSQGVKIAVDSRSVSFAEDIVVANRGDPAAAVNAVLNSLTSPGMVAASLAVVAQGGTFAEIGKRDIWSHARVAQERPDISYRIVAIDFLLAKSLGAKMQQLSELLAAGTVAPPQINSFRLGDAAAAFRKYSQAQHIGKLVLEAPPTQCNASGNSESGSVVISGGLGSLGLLTASWLTGRKEQHLVLLGRSGRASESSIPVIQSGACVVMSKCDTASLEDTAACLSASVHQPSEMPAVHAVYNSGGILSDAMFASQSSSSVRQVFAPKIASTEAMVAGIAAQPVQQLVLFSSAASLFGAPGQANYAAANAALEGYSSCVSASGVGSTAIQWGAWAAGMATDPVVVQRAKRSGLGLLDPHHGLDGLNSILLSATSTSNVIRPVVAAVPVTWSTLLKGSEAETPEFFKDFHVVAKKSAADLTRAAGKQQKKSSKKIRTRSSRKQPNPIATSGRSLESIAMLVSETVRRVLGSEVSSDQPLMQTGMDSLGAVELRNALNSAFAVDLPPTVTFDYPTIAALAGFISENLPTTSTTTAEAAGQEDVYRSEEEEYTRVKRRSRHRKQRGGATKPSAPATTLAGADAAAAIQTQIAAVVASVIGHEVDANEPLMQSGLDSLGAVELRNALNARFGLDLVPTVTIDYPTVAALAGHILTAVGAHTNNGAMVESAVDSPTDLLSLSSWGSSAVGALPISLVSSSSLLPSGPHGAAPSFDTISKVPLSRWDVDGFAEISPNAWEPRFGSFVAGAEAFDAVAFATSRPEAVYMDPQQRILMERTGEVVMQGNVSSSSLPSRTSVMIGIGTVDYVGMSSTLPLGMYFATGGANSVAAGRLSFTFNLTGSCLSIDTACSSSLVAAHYSVSDLRNGTAEAAIAGGVNLTLSPKKAAAFTITGMLTPDGRCKTLDSTADGYVRAETCVVHLLKPVDSAFGEETEGVLILGSAVNQDGKSSSLTAPSGPAQQLVLRDALLAAELDAHDLGGLEMHGTGTALGDPIEVGAALAVFSASTLTFTATKSRMGHAETGAGALGMLNTAAQLNQGFSWPLSHLAHVNPYVATILERNNTGKVSAPRQLMPRDASSPTGISSFAFQGTNAHLIMSTSTTTAQSDGAMEVAALPWQHRRFWFSAMSHPLITSYTWSKSTRTVEMHCSAPTSATSLAYQGGYALGNNPVLPASALVELATAAVRLMCNDDLHAETFAIGQVSFSHQMVAPSTQLCCLMDVASGEVAVAAVSGAASGLHKSLLKASSCSINKAKSPHKFNTSTTSSGLSECFERFESWRPSSKAATAFLEIDAEAIFMPTSACENLVALQMILNNNVADGLRAASCDLLTFSGRSQTPTARFGEGRVMLSTGKTLDGCQARMVSDDVATNNARSSVIQSMGFKSVPLPAPAHAFTVGWRRQELASAEISKPTKWLLLSHSDSVRGLQSICVPSIGDRVQALGVRFCPEEQQTVLSASGVEVVASSAAHLHWLLKCSAPDQILAIQSNSTENCVGETRKEDVYMDSLVWAHAARDLAGNKAKVSTITLSSEDDTLSSKLASAVSKTRFMEDRPSHGINLSYVHSSNSSLLLPSARQLQWLLTTSGETCAVVKHGALYVERLSLGHSAVKPRRGLKLKPTMCCVVTGGTKGLGLDCAKQLAREGCKQLVLTSRSGTLATEDAAEFASLGTSVVVKCCDASNPNDCTALAIWLRENMPAVQVFAHAAGVISFDLLPEMTQEVFEATVLPKVMGARALAAAGIPVEATLLFSSTAAVWSQAGAAHYSAGNSCLDAAALDWQSAGLPGTAVNFGPFGGDGGMASSLSAAMEAVGLRLLDPEAVSAAFKGSGVSPQLGWARINADLFKKVNTVKGPWKFLDELSMAPVEIETPTIQEVGLPAAAPSSGAGVQPPESQGPQLSLAAVEDSVRSIANEILGDGVMDSTGQFAAGVFDSLSAVEFSNKISEMLEITLPGTLVFDYPSVPAIATYVYSKMKPATAKGTASSSVAVLPSTAALAVTSTRHRGDSGALPLRVTIASRTPQSLSSTTISPISAGYDSISIVPFGRWDLEAGSGKTSRVRFASWLPDVASFDPVAFQLTGNEAEVMDPQQRLLLETSWEAIKAVATTSNTSASASVLGIDTGVYVGIQQMEYGGLAAQHLPAMGAYSATSTPFSVAAGRLSFTYGFIGPAVSIDTACSSAMVAAHSAAQHLEKRGGAALSAGINLMLAERTTSAAQIAGMLTVNGRCKTLDAGADGYVRAEACVVMVLQSPDSEFEPHASSTPVLMMRSTFVNQDGKSSSLTAPNGPAQQRVLRGALDAAHALPTDILGLEMHGTGTALGDPIEVGAATAVLPGALLPLRFTAAKSRVGHAEPAAGSIGILQAAAQLMKNETRGIMHLSRVNPYISSIYGELASQGQATPFAPKQDGPGISSSTATEISWMSTIGISSFAFQGTNAHVMLSSMPGSALYTEKEEAQERAVTPWQHKRYWYAAPPSSLLGTAKILVSVKTPLVITFHTNLKKSALSFLHDHRVRSRAVFPAAAMLEATSAAVQAAVETHTSEVITIQGISISSPLLMQPTTALELVCKVNVNSGEVILETGSVQHLGAVGALVRKHSGISKPSLTLMQRMYAQFMEEANKIINTAIPEVAQAAAASAHPAVNATGQLSSSALLTQGQQPDSFTTHPAILDAMTHVVSALQSKESSTAEAAAVTRVPAAIDAFLSAAPGEKATSLSNCSGAFEELLSDGTAVSSFRAISEKAEATSAAIGGFHAKPVRASAGAAAVTAVSAAARMLVSSRNHAATASSATLLATKKSKKVDSKSTMAAVQKLVNTMLNTEVAPNQPLMEAGMDSLGAVELRTALNKAFSVELPATVTFDFPSVSALAGCINTELETVAEEEEEQEWAHHLLQEGPTAAVPQQSPVASGSVAFAASAIQNQQQQETLTAAQVGQKVSAAVNRLLGSQVASDQPLMEAGMDSLAAVELRTALNTAFNADFPATITFDYPTIAALTTFIVANLEEFQLEAPVVEAAPVSVAVDNVVSVQEHAVRAEMGSVPAPLPLVVAGPQPTSTAVVGIGALYPSSQPYAASVSGLSAFERGIKTSADLPRPIPLEVRY